MGVGNHHITLCIALQLFYGYILLTGERKLLEGGDSHHTVHTAVQLETITCIRVSENNDYHLLSVYCVPGAGLNVLHTLLYKPKLSDGLMVGAQYISQ